jgi:hypothetical protein
LNKALYGLKQAPRAWYGHIDIFLMSLDFTKSKTDSNLYFKIMENEPVILLLYMDDLFLIGEENLIAECKQRLAAEFEMKDLLDTPTTLRGGGGGGVNECGALFPKTSLLHKNSSIAFNIYSLPIVFIYNQLDVSTYQQHISAIYHQQVITTMSTKNTRCMYNFFLLRTTILGVY